MGQVRVTSGVALLFGQFVSARDQTVAALKEAAIFAQRLVGSGSLPKCKAICAGCAARNEIGRRPAQCASL